MFGTRRSAIWLPGRKASTPIRFTTTPPLIFLTRVPSTGSSASCATRIFSQTRMKSAFFLERTTAPSWSSRCSRKTSTSSPTARRLLELVERHRALGLEADVEDDGVLGDAQDLRLDDFALGDRRHGALVHREHLLVLVLAVLLVIEVGADQQSGGAHDGVGTDGVAAGRFVRRGGVGGCRVGGVQVGRGGGQLGHVEVIPSGSAAPARLRDEVNPVRGGIAQVWEPSNVTGRPPSC